MKNIFRFVVLLLLPVIALANTVRVHDLAGRDVDINLPVTSLFLADSRDILALDIVTGDKYFSHIAGWSDSLPQFAPDMQAAYVKKYPVLQNIPVIGKSGIDIGAESIIQLKPNLIIANVKSYRVFTETKALEKLDAAGIKTVFVDFMNNVTENTPKSIQLLGEVLESSQRANDFIAIYHHKMATINQRVPQLKHKPTVLIEQHAGLTGLEYCCGLFGNSSFGDLVIKAGGNNLMSGKGAGKSSQVSIESILTMNPQFYMMSGANWTAYSKKSAAVALGYQVDNHQVSAQLMALIQRKGFGELRAVKDKHVMAIYHHFYDNPLNFIAIEAIAEFINPQVFSDINAKADLDDIHQKFISIPATGIFWLTSDHL